MSKKIKNQIKIGNNNKIENSNFGTYIENKSKNESMLKQILTGVFVAVIAGIVVFVITENLK